MSVQSKLKKYKNAEKREKFKLKNKRVKFKKELDEDKLNGVVYSSIGSINVVKHENGNLYECQIAGILQTRYKESSLVAVGDKVKIDLLDEYSNHSELQKGIILAIGKRKTKLSRISPKNKHQEHVISANSDAMLIYMAAENPRYNKRLIDRYIVAARAGDIEPVICINKIDLGQPQDIYDDLIYYEDFGLKVFLISLFEKINTAELKEFLSTHNTVIAGPSGSGKSSLINYIFDEEKQAIGEVSLKTAKGLHTTSFVRMFEYGEGRVIDTPGIREFALWDISKEELPSYFDDFLEFQDLCKFIPCTHTHEPNCAIKTAVEDGYIDVDRYDSYLNLLETLED